MKSGIFEELSNCLQTMDRCQIEITDVVRTDRIARRECMEDSLPETLDEDL